MNYGTQTSLIKTFTQESLNNAIINMKINFDNIKDNMIKELIDGVRLDVYDKMYNSNDDNCDIHFINIDEERKREHGTFKDVIDNIIKLYKLKKGEKYIHSFYNIHGTSTGENNYRQRDYRVLYGLITNYSNMYYIDYLDRRSGHDMPWNVFETGKQTVNAIVHNISLNNIYIDGIKAFDKHISSLFHRNDNCARDKYCCDFINYYKSVLDLNKKNYIKLLAETIYMKNMNHC